MLSSLKSRCSKIKPVDRDRQIIGYRFYWPIAYNVKMSLSNCCLETKQKFGRFMETSKCKISRDELLHQNTKVSSIKTINRQQKNVTFDCIRETKEWKSIEAFSIKLRNTKFARWCRRSSSSYHYLQEPESGNRQKPSHS